ncbi:SEL1-like repeat protein [Legionella gresilensis]|uniref:SEL1-like repeat protein n=1 Tax=Legionella gresilensis TaxID=91823 RepID=UPI00104169B3|nr:SEL1-like repeat protein [Legionella gresilensis]
MSNRAYMYEQGLGGPINLAEAIRLYECAIRHGSTTAQDNLKCIPIYKDLAKQVFASLWNDLITGQSLTQKTLRALIKYCKEDVFVYLKASPLSTSLVFLKQLKTNPLHPIALILNDGKKDHSQEFKLLMAHAQSLTETRIIFFNQGFKKNEYSSFNCLPVEMEEYLFSFIQPGFELDKQQIDDNQSKFTL